MAGTTSGVYFYKQGRDTNLIVYQGKTIHFSLIWGGSSPIDITGKTARMQMRDNSGTLIATFEFSGTQGVVTIGSAVGGQFNFDMSATDSAALPITQGKYDIEIIDGTTVYLATSGNFVIEPEQTQDD